MGDQQANAQSPDLVVVAFVGPATLLFSRHLAVIVPLERCVDNTTTTTTTEGLVSQMDTTVPASTYWRCTKDKQEDLWNKMKDEMASVTRVTIARAQLACDVTIMRIL